MAYYFVQDSKDSQQPKFSGTEGIHLAIGLFLVIFIFAYPMGELMPHKALQDLKFTGKSGAIYRALLIAPAFVLHEFGHKFTARAYKNWSEFRLSPVSVVAMLILLFATQGYGKMAAPGAVVVYGMRATISRTGKIALAGPTVNIGLALFAALISQHYLDPGDMQDFMLYFFLVNFALAAFNMLPFGPLDGRKIIRWSPIAWVLAFAINFGIFWYAIDTAFEGSFIELDLGSMQDILAS